MLLEKSLATSSNKRESDLFYRWHADYWHADNWHADNWHGGQLAWGKLALRTIGIDFFNYGVSYLITLFIYFHT